MHSFALHLIRHGAPDVEGLLLGHQDRPATPKGAAACTAKAAGIEFHQIYSSDLSRCAISAHQISAISGVGLHLDPRLRELDFGAWDGHSPTDLPVDMLRDFWADPDAHPPPNGETWSIFTQRIAAALADIPPAPTLIVTHGGTMRAMLHLLLGWPQEHIWSLDLPYACRLSLRIWPKSTWQGQIQALIP